MGETKIQKGLELQGGEAEKTRKGTKMPEKFGNAWGGKGRKLGRGLREGKLSQKIPRKEEKTGTNLLKKKKNIAKGTFTRKGTENTPGKSETKTSKKLPGENGQKVQKASLEAKRRKGGPKGEQAMGKKKGSQKKENSRGGKEMPEKKVEVRPQSNTRREGSLRKSRQGKPS